MTIDGRLMADNGRLSLSMPGILELAEAMKHEEVSMIDWVNDLLNEVVTSGIISAVEDQADSEAEARRANM